jgi:hypothetical protein
MKKNWRNKLLWTAWLAACVIAAGMFLAGCSGGSGSGVVGPENAYTLSITQPENGAITTNPAAGKVNEGAVVTVNVIPVYGYTVSKVRLNGAEITPQDGVYSFPMPGANAAVTAEITAHPDSYLITTKAIEEDGAPIDINDVITFTITGKTNVKDRAFEDDEIKVSTEVLTGYDLQGITVTDSSGDVDIDDNDIFTMPADDVTITAVYALQAGYYRIHVDPAIPEAEGKVEFSPVGAAQAAAVITITVTPKAGYDVEEVKVLNHAGVDVSAEVGLAAAGTNSWQFNMPADDVTLTATFSALAGAAHAVNAGSLTNGTISFTGLDAENKAAAGATVTVTAHPAAGYETDGVPTSTPLVTFTPTSADTWTFPMPPSDITVSIAFKASGPALYTVGKGSLTNGNISFTGVDADNKAVAGATVTVTALPASGYEVNGAPTSSPPVAFTPSGSDTWTFPMPPANITVSVAFAVIPPPYVIYKGSDGGLRSGVSVTGVEQWSGYWANVNTVVDANAAGQGRNGGTAIKLFDPAASGFTEIGFALTSDTPVNLADNRLVGLSFWLKGDRNRNSILMGFGNSTATNATRKNVWIDPVYDTQNAWKRYVVPVPSNRSVDITELFALKLNVEEGDAYYIDDIEFITTGVTGISTDAVFSSTPTYTLLSAEPFDVLQKLNELPVIGGVLTGDPDSPTLISTTYTVPGGGTVILSNALFGGLTYKVTWNNWLTYSVTGAASINGMTVTPNSLGSQFTVNVMFDGARSSNAVTFKVVNILPVYLEDFTDVKGRNWGWFGDFCNTTYRYWAVNANNDGNNSILARNEVDYNTVTNASSNTRIMKITPKDDTTAVGRNLPAPANISVYSTVSFLFRVNSADANTYALVLYNGGTASGYTGTAEAGNGTGYEVEFTNPAANTWVWIDIPLADFTGLNKAAVTGYGIRTKTSTDTASFYLDTIVAR